MTAAMILAAGLGTRLRPLTDELPKPLAWVGDMPAIGHVARGLAGAGIRFAAVNVYHLPEAFTVERLAALPLELAVVHEPVLLGTAGGLANAASVLPPGDVVVWNGDILAELDVGSLLAAHAARAAAATLAVTARVPACGEMRTPAGAPRDDRARAASEGAAAQPGRRRAGEGTVGLSADGTVVRLRGERFGEEVRGADFLGIQIVGEAARGRLPQTGCLVGDVYLPMLRAGMRIASHEVDLAWDDIGGVASYLLANARWLRRHGLGRFVGEGASVAADAPLEGTVVAPGARVSGGPLRGCVVWPGAVARGPLDGAVVTTRGAVVRVGEGAV